MILALLIGLSVLAVALAIQSAAPATAASRRRAAARRARFVAAHPIQVNAEDIVRTLRREGMSARRARSVIVRARILGISPFTMWLWLERFDGESLGVVVAADLTHQELLMHLGTGSAPVMHEARIFASANGWELGGAEALARASVLRPPVFGRIRRVA